MSEQTPVTFVSSPEIVVPPRPSPTADLEAEADAAIWSLSRLVNSPRLNPELRLDLNNVLNTLKNLKATVVRQHEEAETSHERLTEVVRSQRLHG